MDESRFQELERELEKAKQEAYAKEKAKSEVEAVTDIVSDTNRTLQTKLNSKLAQHIDNNQIVAEKIEKTADKLVEKGLQVQDNKATANIMMSEDEILEADYVKNKNEYLYHGIDHKIDKEWKRKIILIINDIWFVIWALVSFFTIVPVSTFLSRIKALSGLVRLIAIIIGVILLLLCVLGVTYAVLDWSGLLAKMGIK